MVQDAGEDILDEEKEGESEKLEGNIPPMEKSKTTKFVETATGQEKTNKPDGSRTVSYEDHINAKPEKGTHCKDVPENEKEMDNSEEKASTPLLNIDYVSDKCF